MPDFIVHFFYKEGGGLTALGKLVYIVALLLLAIIIVSLLRRFINKTILRSKLESLPLTEKKKAYTLAALLKSVSKAIVVFLWTMMSLNILGINTGALLATAGMGGLAIGFGAQTLVKDFIGGFFIIFENQYEIGDYVNLSGRDGIVENIALRTTTIKDFNGEKHIIPNGDIRIVTNRSKNDQRALVQFGISYESDIAEALRVLEKALSSLKNEPDILEGPNVLGVSDLGESAVTILAVARTKPQSQWEIERKMRRVGKEALDANGIEIPYSKLDVNILGGKQ